MNIDKTFIFIIPLLNDSGWENDEALNPADSTDLLHYRFVIPTR